MTAKPNLLLVCNPTDRDEIEGALQSSGLGDVHFASGEQETLSELERLEPGVVILSADLDLSDPRTLATAVREASVPAAVVLIGQVAGPIRNALDASDFDVDHFVGRPIAANALAYAVRMGLEDLEARRQRREGEAEASAALSDADIATRAATQSVIGEAMDEAIDAFLDEAIAAIPGDIADEDDEDDEDEDEDEEQNAGEALAPGDAAQLPQQAVPTAAHDAPTGQVTAGDLHEDTTAPAGWREETMVLSGGGGQGADPDSASPSAAVEGSEPDESPQGSHFARELRKKMSLMAERLFPGEQKDVELGVSHGAHTEIDLSSLGGGNTSVPIDSDYQHTYSGSEETTGPWVADEAADSGTQPHVSVGRAVRHAIDAHGHDVASTLARLFDLGVTGRVTFQGGGAEKVIFLDRGRPVFASSSLPHDRMGDLLYREGKLTRTQHIRSRELVAESGKRMGEILVAEGFLKQHELMPAVRRHLEDLIYSLFGWEEGEYEVVEDVMPSSEKIQLSRHPAALIAEGVRRKYDLPRLLRVLGSDNPIVALTEAERVNALVQQIEILPAEERAISLFDGRTTLHEVAEGARIDLLSAAQIAFSLVALGAAEVVNETVTQTEVTIDTSSPNADDNVEIDRQRILAKHELVVESDYFRLLGVRRDASAFEIRRAYEQAMRDYAPESFAEQLQRELSGELVEIGQVLGEAAAVLADDRIRTAYLSNLRD